MGELVIQPVGGFVGANSEGSHVRSEGRMAESALSAADRAAVDALFAAPPAPRGNMYYRLTRRRDGGSETVDAPVDAVPAALVASIATTLD